ncbi:hypothetical protein UY3_00802 [Chelonia mydas]|uniref:Uncharacterized protein n=1 Tax=Chelonia mydas TaxID=8469 RepID=M7BVU0_CHEMY|nr:hypothetical protein UY3_00802 [Chelonia mydas]
MAGGAERLVGQIGVKPYGAAGLQIIFSCYTETLCLREGKYCLFEAPRGVCKIFPGYWVGARASFAFALMRGNPCVLNPALGAINSAWQKGYTASRSPVHAFAASPVVLTHAFAAPHSQLIPSPSPLSISFAVRSNSNHFKSINGEPGRKDLLLHCEPDVVNALLLHHLLPLLFPDSLEAPCGSQTCFLDWSSFSRCVINCSLLSFPTPNPLSLHRFSSVPNIRDIVQVAVDLRLQYQMVKKPDKSYTYCAIKPTEKNQKWKYVSLKCIPYAFWLTVDSHVADAE